MSNNTMPALPALPRTSRRQKPLVACACGGCGKTTRSRWFPGHDGYCTGWSVRVERGLVKATDVPETVVRGVAHEFERRNPGKRWADAVEAAKKVA